MRSEAVRWFVRGFGLALGASIVVAIATIVLLAGQVLILVFLSVLLGSALEPVIGAVRSRVPIGRGPTILVVYVAFFVAVVALAVVVIPDAIGQLDQFLGRLPGTLRSTREAAARLEPAAAASVAVAAVDFATRAMTPPSHPTPAAVVQAGLTVAEAAVSLVTLLALVFFWLTEHAWLQRYVLSFVPAGRRAGSRDAWNQIETRLGLWVRGQLILMAAVGIAAAVVYSMLGLPSPVLLGLLAAIAEAVPMIGPFLGAIPALLAAGTISLELVIVVAVVYIAIQFVESNVLVPLVMRNTIGISPFLVVVSLLVGGAVGGIPGAFLAVPIIAAIEVVLERLQARELPVAQDPNAVEAPSPRASRDMGASLPDSRGAREP